eukprot:4061131-Amphidinium_carterae.1
MAAPIGKMRQMRSALASWLCIQQSGSGQDNPLGPTLSPASTRSKIASWDAPSHAPNIEEPLVLTPTGLFTLAEAYRVLCNLADAGVQTQLLLA